MKCKYCDNNANGVESNVCYGCLMAFAGIKHIVKPIMYINRDESPKHADAIERLVNADCDGGNGEFDTHVDALVHARFPNVIEWETDDVSFDARNVILHNAHVAICP